MSDTDTTGFGKFVPGFDFLQTLAKGASNNIPQMPNLGNWVAPTLNVEELEKRIDELKAVHFWLEQNSRALGATIQALEVQKMTLATLKGMNFNIGDVANALKLKAAESVHTGVQRVTERAASTAKTISDVATGSGSTGAKVGKAAAGVGSLVDPLQLWGSLTQQFQQIAAGAFKEASAKTAVDVTKNMATGMAKEAIKSAKAAGRQAAGGAVKRATKPAARKTAPRRSQ
ncbi:MAG: PhaM family polyhydroxyalkanoate granule multifunctional regulatory protein [Rhodoferax sp.]